MELHSTLETESVLAMFRETGSFDPDVLDDRRTALLRRARVARRKGTAFLAVGCVLSLTVVGAMLGIPLAWIGLRFRELGAQHVRSVRQAYEVYTRFSPNVIQANTLTAKGGSRCSDS